MCCGKKMKAYVPTKWDYKEITVQCGNTSLTGDPYLCDACAKLHEHTDWAAQAAECGESYGDVGEGFFD